MTPSTDMLRKLASGVHPGLTAAPGAARSPAESQPFEELLAAAKGSAFRSEPVKLAKGSKIELSPEQLRRLGSAVDGAEAHGASTLLAFIDGQGVIVDVASRTVSGVARPGQGVVPGVDAVAVIPDAPSPITVNDALSARLTANPGPASANAAPNATDTPRVALPLPSTESIRNADVARLLAALQAGPADAALA